MPFHLISGHIALSGLEFGNIFMALQPPRGYGMDTDKSEYILYDVISLNYATRIDFDILFIPFKFIICQICLHHIITLPFITGSEMSGAPMQFVTWVNMA